jgi:hypothetical protein
MESLLLGTDPVTLFRTGGDDAHGWALPDDAVLWEGAGNLQLAPGPSDAGAADAGGHGPFDPAAGLSGTLYLPADATPAEGCPALIGEAWFYLSQVRAIADPTLPRLGGISCWVASVTAVGAWEVKPDA